MFSYGITCSLLFKTQQELIKRLKQKIPKNEDIFQKGRGECHIIFEIIDIDLHLFEI